MMKTLCAFGFAIGVGYNFGAWQHDVNAGFFAFCFSLMLHSLFDR